MTRFVKVHCPKCKNEQVIFGKASSQVDCLICGQMLSHPTGSRSVIKARVLEVLE